MKTSHSLEYINHIRNKTLDMKLQKKIGFPINDSVVRRSFVATGGTVLASKLALDSSKHAILQAVAIMQHSIVALVIVSLMMLL